MDARPILESTSTFVELYQTIESAKVNYTWWGWQYITLISGEKKYISTTQIAYDQIDRIVTRNPEFNDAERGHLKAVELKITKLDERGSQILKQRSCITQIFAKIIDWMIRTSFKRKHPWHEEHGPISAYYYSENEFRRAYGISTARSKEKGIWLENQNGIGNRPQGWRIREDDLWKVDIVRFPRRDVAPAICINRSR